jgi:hypothetical protein
MTRLTIHLAEPIFFDAVQTNIGTKENVILKPKNKKCINTTLSFKDISNEYAKHIIGQIRNNHGIATWSKGTKKGQEMIYIVN